MIEDNKFVKNIALTVKQAEFDKLCKKVLSFKIILAWIMKSCLEEYKNYNVNERAEKYIEGNPQIEEETVNQDEIIGMNTEDNSITEGTVTYDIIFYAVVPDSESNELIKLILNVEAQNKFNPGYSLIKRAVYYCSRMISSQYGTEFDKSQYDKIKKVYSIWICTNSPKKRHNTITRYSIKEDYIVGKAVEKVQNYDLLSVVLICLGNEDEENYGGILKLLKTLLSSDTKVEEKKKILQNDFNIEMAYKMEEEVRNMCNISYGILEEGIEKGIEKGILNSIKNLMESMNLEVNQAMNALKIPENEQSKYLKILSEGKYV